MMVTPQFGTTKPKWNKGKFQKDKDDSYNEPGSAISNVISSCDV